MLLVVDTGSAASELIPAGRHPRRQIAKNLSCREASSLRGAALRDHATRTRSPRLSRLAVGSGADEPGNGLGGFVDLGVGVGSARAGGVGDAVAEMVVEQA